MDEARNPKSFCIPNAAIQALVEAKADALTIGAYLTLACYTDATGQYSTASATAIARALGTNKVRARKAIAALSTIQPKGQTKRSRFALVYARDSWKLATGEVFPDGPVARAKVLHVLPTFDEPLAKRVWFGSNLVRGIGTFTLPLKRLKDAGDVAARLFLLMTQRVDMPNYGGIPPNAGPWHWYELTKSVEIGPSRLIHGMRRTEVMNMGLMKDASAETEKAWAAFHAIVDGGLFYEVVMVLNRAPVDDKFANGDEYHGVPVDAEPLYELDARSLHGYKPKGEEGLAGLTAKTAGELHHPVASGILLDAYDNERTPHDGEDAKPGQFYGKYAAIVPRGYGAMIAGIFRPRFRVANPKNAGTKDAWIRIHTGQAQGLEWITALRASQGLEPLPAPRIATKDEL